MRKTCVLMFIASLLAGCSDPSLTDSEITRESIVITPIDQPSEPASLPSASFSPVAAAFQQAAQEAIQQTQTNCQVLFSDITFFLNSLNEQAQQQAQASFAPCYQSWVDAQLYFQTPFTLSESKEFAILIGLIDTRPYLPGYIDGIPEYPYSGLVHELDVPMTESALRKQHRLMDEESASVGFPVVELFLWRTPVNDVWHTDIADNRVVVERRLRYLTTATSQLQKQLQKASLRWQGERFTSLPERAQLNVILQSSQRLVMVELLRKLFNESVLAEPEWHHPTPISGQGRNYTLALVQSLQAFIGQPGAVTPFSEWLNTLNDLQFTSAELQSILAVSAAAIADLPENYPAETALSENWQTAQQSLAQVSLYIHQLMQYYRVPLLIE